MAEKILSVWQVMLQSAGKLSGFVLISILLLLGVKTLTDPVVKEAERQNLLNTLNEVMPASQFNNDPLQDTLVVNEPDLLSRLGLEEPVTLYRARLNGQPAGIILKTLAPNGYSGNIEMLMGVYADGRVAGVRVLKHKETPGLGDKIELSKAPWILEFDGRSLRDDNDPRWTVKKDGGDFDQFTGATITPRAVVLQVKQTLQLVNENRDRFYE